MNDFSMQLAEYMKRNVPMGEFILKKQCQDMGIDHENIPPECLNELAGKLSAASEIFVGYDRSRSLRTDIIRQRLEVV